MLVDLGQLHERIEALATEPRTATLSSLQLAAAVEDLLCDGYAVALELDAAGSRAQQRIEELLAAPAGPRSGQQLRRLTRQRAAAAAQAADLRRRLEAMRERVAASPRG